MTEVPCPHVEAAIASAPMARIQVRLGDLGLAKENLRYAEPAGGGVAQLADTVAAAGVVIAPIVRPGRKGELAYMTTRTRSAARCWTKARRLAWRAACGFAEPR